jgi:hypothetical protein
VVALLPTGDTATLTCDGMTTTGAIAMRRYDKAGALVESIVLGE